MIWIAWARSHMDGGRSPVHALRFIQANGAGLVLLVERATVASMTMDTKYFRHPMSIAFSRSDVYSTGADISKSLTW